MATLLRNEAFAREILPAWNSSGVYNNNDRASNDRIQLLFVTEYSP